MVRRHDHNQDDDPNKASSGRNSTAAGLSVLELPQSQPKGRFAFIRATSVSSTRAALPSRRLRFALFVDNKWRREERALKTLPRAVTLKRFATDLRVLLRAMGFGIRLEINSRGRNDKRFIVSVECAHDDDWCVDPSFSKSEKVEIRHEAEKTIVRIPPMPELDRTDWLAGPRGGPQVKVTLPIERVWWGLGDVNKQPQLWRDTPLSLSAADFTATCGKVVWFRLPKARWTGHVDAGFQSDKPRAYPLRVAERALAIPLRDFSDAPELGQPTRDCSLKVWIQRNEVFYEAIIATVPAERTEETLGSHSTAASVSKSRNGSANSKKWNVKWPARESFRSEYSAEASCSIIAFLL